MVSASANDRDELMGDRPPIVDAHCHVASTLFIPDSFVHGVVSNSVAWSVRQRRRMADIYFEKLTDHECDDLVAEMDAARIDHTVLLCTDFTYALKDCRLTIQEMFDRHADVLRKYPGRFTVFAGVDPRWGSDGTALFERGVDQYGFRGMKVYPPCGFSPSDPALYPFYEICSDASLPVTVHIGPTSPALSFEHGRPELIDRAARDFPKVNFILAHGSVSYAEECALMAAFRPNVYIDISAFESASPKSLEGFLQRGLNHKLLFGTDFPVFRMRGSQSEIVGPLFEPQGAFAGMSQHDLETLLYRNALRLIPGLAEALAPVRAS